MARSKALLFKPPWSAIAGGIHTVLYVATMHNTVFALDADTGAQLSVRWLGTPITGFDLGVLKPVTIHSEFGVVSTPVIDPDTGTIYVVHWGYDSGISGPTVPSIWPRHV